MGPGPPLREPLTWRAPAASPGPLTPTPRCARWASAPTSSCRDTEACRAGFACLRWNVGFGRDGLSTAGGGPRARTQPQSLVCLQGSGLGRRMSQGGFASTRKRTGSRSSAHACGVDPATAPASAQLVLGQHGFGIVDASPRLTLELSLHPMVLRLLTSAQCLYPPIQRRVG